MIIHRIFDSTLQEYTLVFISIYDIFGLAGHMSFKPVFSRCTRPYMYTCTATCEKAASAAYCFRRKQIEEMICSIVVPETKQQEGRQARLQKLLSLLRLLLYTSILYYN